MFSQSVTIIRSASPSPRNLPTFCLDSSSSHRTDARQEGIKDSGVPRYGRAQLLQLWANLPGSSLLPARATEARRCTSQPELHPDLPKSFLLRGQVADVILMHFQVLRTRGEASGSAVELISPPPGGLCPACSPSPWNILAFCGC